MSRHSLPRERVLRFVRTPHLFGKRQIVESIHILDPLSMPGAWIGCLGTVRPDGTVTAWAFVGSSDPSAQPLEYLQAVHRWSQSDPEGLILAPSWPGSSIGRKLRLALIDLLQPVRVETEEADLCDAASPVPMEPVEGPEEWPAVMRAAHEKARWLDLSESLHPISVPMETVAWVGGRWGSANQVQSLVPAAPKIAALVAVQSGGGSALVLADAELTAEEVGQLTRWLGVQKVRVHLVSAYSGLLVGLASASGQDLGIGILDSLDFQRGQVQLRSNLLDGASVRLIRLGLLRSLGERGQWQAVPPGSV
ncbi:MAG TPA: hypothetical protein PKY51_08070 [Fimbriimonadaceae bacterium]|nr:hypothetical protein [Fimbriimonadaceae bacterium]